MQPQVIKITDLSEFITPPVRVVGDALDFYKDKITPIFQGTLTEEDLRSSYPCALVMAQMFHQNKESWKAITWQELLPFYIRLSSAEEKRLVLSQD